MADQGGVRAGHGLGPAFPSPIKKPRAYYLHICFIHSKIDFHSHGILYLAIFYHSTEVYSLESNLRRLRTCLYEKTHGRVNEGPAATLPFQTIIITLCLLPPIICYKCRPAIETRFCFPMGSPEEHHTMVDDYSAFLGLLEKRISKFSPTMVDDYSAFFGLLEERISKFSPTTVDDYSAFLRISEKKNFKIFFQPWMTTVYF